MSELTKVIKTLQEMQQIHEKLIKEFVSGGIFDPVAGPILKEHIEKIERFIQEAVNAKTVDEMNEIFRKHFGSKPK